MTHFYHWQTGDYFLFINHKVPSLFLYILNICSVSSIQRLKFNVKSVFRLNKKISNSSYFDSTYFICFFFQSLTPFLTEMIKTIQQCQQKSWWFVDLVVRGKPHSSEQEHRDYKASDPALLAPDHQKHSSHIRVETDILLTIFAKMSNISNFQL